MKLNRKIVVLIVILSLTASGGAYYFWHLKTGVAEKGANEGKVVIATDEETKRMEMLGHVSVSLNQRILANIAVVEAMLTPFDKEINAAGIVQYDQSRQARVVSWVAGRIDRLYVNKVGDYVTNDKPVALIYSPDLVSAQQEYLLALRNREQFRNSPLHAISHGGEGGVAPVRDKLKLMGVKDEQIAALVKEGQPNIKLEVYTPLTGLVTEKVVLEGEYVKVGATLFNIADLSTVWVEVEVYENEVSFVKIGDRVDIVCQSYPGRTFRGKVAYIYPFLDPTTRTVKVRVEIPNPRLVLKPNMFVNATIRASVGIVLVVPETAVLDTGARQVVWVEMQPGMFEPRDVKVGFRERDKVQIVSGVKAGELVASSGAYLIDSEAQLKKGGGMPGMKMEEMPGMRMEERKGTLPTTPSPKKGGGMDMKDMKM